MSGIPFDLIAQTAMLRAEDLLREWFPEGRVRGAEFVVGSLEGERGESLSFNLTKGYGMDFATGEKFGDLIDLYAGRFNCSKGEAARSLADKCGLKVDFPRAGTTVMTEVRRTKNPQNWKEAFLAAKCIPIPEKMSFDPKHFAIPVRGAPDAVYVYRDREGHPMWVVTRWDAVPSEHRDKHFQPWSWAGDGWRRAAPGTPRSLYGLEQLTKTKNVILCEGEKAAEAARTLFPSFPVLSWPFGANGVKNADWSDLKGRRVVVWPDADAAGMAALNEIARHLNPITSEPVRYVDPGPIGGGEDAADLGNLTEAEAFEWIKPRIKKWEEPPKQAVKATLERKLTRDKPAKLQPPLKEPPELAVTEERAGQWAGLQLETAKSGQPYPSTDNALRVLNVLLPADDVHYDTFLNQVRIATPKGFERLSDHHIVTFTIAMQRDFGLQNLSKGTVADAVAFYARARQRNCLQEWLKSLTWDNQLRADVLMIRGFGAADTPYTRSVSRNFLVGMAARAMRPGCQLDTLPILEGEQGIGKSRGLEALGGEWYADIDAAMGSKEFCEQIQGKWLVELSELSAMRPSEVEKVKSTITRTNDVYREPFAILATDHPRQCAFAGTTNAQAYLQDSTGNRRFWPIKCGTIDRAWLRDNREQLFAEAAHLLANGTTWWDMDPGLAQLETDQRTFVDGLVERVRDYCLMTSGHVRINEILQSWDVSEAQWTSPLQRRVADALRAVGYFPVKMQGRQVWRRVLDGTNDGTIYGTTPGQPRDNHGTIAGTKDGTNGTKKPRRV